MLYSPFPHRRDSSNITAFFVLKTAANDKDNINDLPNNKTTASEELNNTRNNLASIDTVHTAKSILLIC